MSSAQQYRITIGLDDSELKKKLANLQKGFTNALFGGGSTGGKGGGGTGAMKNLAKLGAIAAGIGGILIGINKLVSMTVSASPVLQTMLKLLNVGIMFILRPIGDFLAFFLKPFIIIFVRASLEFYKLLSPIMRRMGSKLGEALIPDFGNIGQLIVDAILGTGGGNPLQKALMVLFSEIKIPEIKLPTLDNIFGDITKSWDSIAFQFNVLQRRITNFVPQIPGKIFDGLVSLGGLISSGAIDIYTNHILPAFTIINEIFSTGLMPIVQSIGTLFQGILTDLTTTVSSAWDGIVSFFQGILEWLQNIPSFFTDLFAPKQAASSGQSNSGGTTVNFYDTIVQGAEGIFEFGEESIANLRSALAGRG